MGSKRRQAGRHEEDAVLVGRCLDGDSRAWEDLLTRHRPLILAVASRNGIRGTDVEDVYQAVCVTLMERLALLRDHRSLAAWVATTTARKCWRLAERSRRAPPDVPPRNVPLPEDEFLAAAEQAAVRGALEQLGDRCRTILKLVFFEELPYKEIAGRLGLATGSIGVYYRRCLERLRSRLRADGWLDREPPEERER